MKGAIHGDVNQTADVLPHTLIINSSTQQCRMDLRRIGRHVNNTFERSQKGKGFKKEN